MCTKYARDERTIILVVIAANADMSTSDGLKLAMEEDKEGKRTIGVITKIDIMDRGTDARKMLMNQEIPLKLGYIGVKGRS
jgi:replication fork clamp-binding protein CrfC